MFELESMTKVRVLDVRVLSKKDRKPDEPPGAQLLLQASFSSDALVMFDGYLPGMLFRHGDTKKQGSLDGIEAVELTSIGDHVKRLPWQYEQTGCDIEIDRGIGGLSNIKLSDCKVHRVSISPRQGSVLVQWSIDAPGLSSIIRGQLTDLKSTEAQMTMHGPAVDDRQADLVEAAPKGRGRRSQSAGVLQ